MKTKEDILFECWHESNDTSPTNETILKAMDRFAKEYHAEQLRIGIVSNRRELLIAFADKWMSDTNYIHTDEIRDEIVDDFESNL